MSLKNDPALTRIQSFSCDIFSLCSTKFLHLLFSLFSSHRILIFFLLLLQTENGSALHEAALFGKMDVVRLLLESGRFTKKHHRSLIRVVCTLSICLFPPGSFCLQAIVFCVFFCLTDCGFNLALGEIQTFVCVLFFIIFAHLPQ